MLGHTTGEIQDKELSKIWRNDYVKTIRVFALIIRLMKKIKKQQYEITPIKEISRN